MSDPSEISYTPRYAQLYGSYFSSEFEDSDLLLLAV